MSIYPLCFYEMFDDGIFHNGMLHNIMIYICILGAKNKYVGLSLFPGDQNTTDKNK